MSDFSLIKSLQTPVDPKTQSPLPEGIRYEEYEVDTYDCDVVKVFIPLSESEAFESELSDYTVVVRSDVRSLMRKYRGIIGN